MIDLPKAFVVNGQLQEFATISIYELQDYARRFNAHHNITPLGIKIITKIYNEHGLSPTLGEQLRKFMPINMPFPLRYLGYLKSKDLMVKENNKWRLTAYAERLILNRGTDLTIDIAGKQVPQQWFTRKEVMELLRGN